MTTEPAPTGSDPTGSRPTAESDRPTSVRVEPVRGGDRLPLPTPQSGGTDIELRGAGLPGERGRTSIATVVVEKIAGTAAREVPGVHDFGGSLARSLGAVRERVPGSRPSVTRGLKVEVGEKQTAVDVELVVEYGVEIRDVAADVRQNVIAAVERMTGLEVVEVNVSVVDVKLPDDDDEDGRPAGDRVR
jgi:uncharacterized alkaline shock family protein YloU